MKKILLTITAFLVTLFAVAQSPNLLNYQGVARNAVGNVIPSQPIGLRLSILSGGPTGTPVYVETRNVTTNAFGLFNVQVGSPGAITTTGTIAGINWTAFGAGSGTKYLQVEIDPIGGTSYFNVGSTQLVSVPYALYAAAGAPVGPAGGDLTGTYPNPQILFPLVKTFNFNASPLIGMTNSATTGTTGAIQGTSASTDGSAVAIQGTISSTSPGGFSAAVRGVNNGTAGLGIGVWGSQAGSGWGVYGTTANGIGVNGLSTTSIGVQGTGPTGIGVQGLSTSGFGVRGESTTGIAVLGVSNGGQAGRFENFLNTNPIPTVGVRNAGGTGAAMDVVNEGTGTAGTFTVNNVASTADALRAVTNGVGASWAIRATSTGTNGAGLFISNNPTATNNNLQSNTNGLGRAGLFNSTNAASASNGVDINVAGTGVALRAASSNATPKALLTAGGVQLTGIGEANNLILKSDAVGNANWATPAAVGIVTGTGTLNFVPKWTPNGTNLGNSQLFDNGTNVGVGTITPTSKFSVEVGNNDGIGINSTGTSFANASLGFSNTTTAPAQTNSANIALKSGVGDRALQFFNSTAGLNPTDRIYNFLNNTTASIVSVLNNGNVGVGTGAPQHTLSVGPTTTDAQTVQVRGFGGTNPNWKGAAAFGNTNATVIMGENANVATIGGNNVNLSAWQPLAINPAPGYNVGIGTFTPAYALDVNHLGGIPGQGLRVRSLASYSVIDLDAANGDAALRYQSAGTTRWNVRNEPTNNDYQILRNNSIPANVTIKNNTGYVGIGQTAPAYQLDVLHAGGAAGALGIRSKSSATFSVVDVDAANGDEAVRFMNNGAGDWHIGGGVVPGAGGFDIFDLKASAYRMVIMNGTGNVGIGTTAPITRLHVEADAPGSAIMTYRNTNNAGYDGSWYVSAAGGLMGHLGYGNPGTGLWTNQFYAGSIAAIPFVFTTSDQERMRITATGDVGVGTGTPNAKLEVANAGTNMSAFVNQTNAANGNFALRVADANTSNVGTGNSAFFARRGVATGIEYFWNGEPVAVTGVSSTGPGVQGSSSTNVGVVGETNSGVGVYAFSGTPAGYALQTYGQVQITGQGAGAGKVLTSDAVGNATWQDNTSQSVGISIRGLGAGVSVPSNTTVPITQWSFIDNEDGGANYNGTTGEYTVTKAGVYQVNCTVMWNSFSSAASFVNLLTRVNGAYYTEQFGPSASSNTFSHLNFSKRYAVGDKINFELFQNSAGTQSTLGNFGSNTLSIQFLHK